MTTRTPPLAQIVLAMALGGCSAGMSASYRRRIAEGDREYSSGRFHSAAVAYEGAAADAEVPRDRNDARYRAAMACRRVGDRACTERLLSLVTGEGSDWEHRARARLQLAVMGLDSTVPSEIAAAHRSLAALVEEAPDTGPARGALRLRLRALDAEIPIRSAAITWLGSLAANPRIQNSLMIESVLAERAIRIEATGDPVAAETAWLAVVEFVPYPDNSHWDDGHFALARVQRAVGRPRDALATLARMLAVREVSWGNGSYAAPRFDDGAMLAAEILRDDLDEPRAAADAFHRVFSEHRTSLRRDNALWEEAALRRKDDLVGACVVWRTLLVEFPCQRFARRAVSEMAACPGLQAAAPVCPGRD